MRRKIIPYSPNLKALAKSLRKQITYSEVVLWNRLKNFQMMGYDFDRQRPILNYIVDFYCKDLFLVIEVDGITHYDINIIQKDAVRDDELAEYNIIVLRVNALDIVNKTVHVLKILENWIMNFEVKNGVAAHIIKRRKGL